MAFLMTHFYPGGTREQYQAVLHAVHPGGRLPLGQLSSAVGPSEGGWLISAVWESRKAYEAFVADLLMPALNGLVGGFETAPEERLAELIIYQSA